MSLGRDKIIGIANERLEEWLTNVFDNLYINKKNVKFKRQDVFDCVYTHVLIK